jgi:hypothetical protein
MSLYLKQFSTHSEYEQYINGGGVILPNVSLTVDNNTVHYNPYVEPETRVVAKYNVTDTSNPTRIGYNAYTSGFSAIEIDGVEQPNVVSAYTFDTTGEHTVKYTLKDPTSIGDFAFSNCSGLTSIDIPSGVTSIGDSAFVACSGLTSIDIPSGVTSISIGVFQRCYGLTSIGPIGSGASLEIPSGVTSIGNYAFGYCTGLTSIDISNGVTSIGEYAFQWCSSLTSVTISNSVTSIGNRAFNSCSKLTSCTIGSGVTSIGNNAFTDCYRFTSIVSNAITAPTIQNNTFYSIGENGTLTVPSGSTGYDVWMGTSNYYLGKYKWTKVEQ